jgi:hypothetical protein
MDGYLRKGKTELMFLCAYDESPYSPVNPAQGIVEVKDDNILYSSSKYSIFGYSNSTDKGTDTLEIAISEIKTCIE